MLEKQYHDELKIELEGSVFSNKKADDLPDVVDKDDTQEANDHVDDANKQAEKDAADISKALMSRKQRGLLEAIEVCFLHVILMAQLLMTLALRY